MTDTPEPGAPDLWAEYDAAVERLLDAISDDDNTHGGLLSRDTIRRADETRMARSRVLAASQGLSHC
jgi:hypothetical protein